MYDIIPLPMAASENISQIEGILSSFPGCPPSRTVRTKPVTYSGGKILPSALPWYAVSENDSADCIYTKREIARHCLRAFRKTAAKHGYDLRAHTFIEPSAGEGCFMDLLPPARRIALDVRPVEKEIVKADFLEWSPPKAGRYAVIGNPPFGVRGAIALAFVNRAARFADIVGFILPMTFASNGKGGAMTRVCGLSLLHSEELPPNAFYLPNGEARDINTVFQVWGARKTAAAAKPPTCDSYVRIYTVCTSPARRCGLTRMGEYDFFLQGTFYENRPPQVVTDFADVKYGSGYGVIIRKNKRAVAAALKAADWSKHSSRATNHCRHIRIAQIRAALMEAGFKDRQ